MAALTPRQVALIPPATRVLEVGCGQVKRVPHSRAVDFNPRTVADIIHDLNVVPYPFATGEFDIVIGEHVIEHLDDVVQVMEELHRITAPGGVIYIEVPHFSSANSFTDPTHRHAFSTRTFDYFIPGTQLGDYRYSTAAFRKRRVEIGFAGRSVLQRAIARWANRTPDKYERKYAFILPADFINFELEAMR